METVSTMCNICKCPCFMCCCDSSWELFFDKIIATTCQGRTVDETSYTSLNVSTMTVCFNFNQSLNLTLLKERLPESLMVKYNPGSKKSKVPKKRGTDSFYNSFDIKINLIDHDTGICSNVSVFIFPNGKAKAAGIKTIKTINVLRDELLELINYVPDTVNDLTTLDIENLKIQMICSDFKIKPVKPDPDGWCIRQEELKNILVKHGLSATFSALSRYPGINLKIPSLVDTDKNISLLIFRSGSIIITGGKYAKDVSNCYNFITKIVTENNKALFYYDINEEIKQKKKKKMLI